MYEATSASPATRPCRFNSLSCSPRQLLLRGVEEWQERAERERRSFSKERLKQCREGQGTLARERVCEGHGIVSGQEFLQELHERKKIPSSRPSKQAPLGTNSKSEEEPAWDLLLNAPVCL